MDSHKFNRWAEGVQGKDVIGYGTSGYVARLPNTDEVIKAPHPNDKNASDRCSREREIYERFESVRDGRPESIIKYRGVRNDGCIRLDYVAGGNVRQHLLASNGRASSQQILRWAKQASQALAFCHANSIVHGDISCSNFFLDHDQNLKLGDFAGSSIDGSAGLVCYQTTHQLPDVDDFSLAHGCRITVETDIFAFGSSLYEMVTGHQPYDLLTDGEVERRFRRKCFPDTTDLRALGLVINRCWNLKIGGMTEVLDSIESEGAWQEKLGHHIVRDPSNPPLMLMPSQRPNIIDTSYLQYRSLSSCSCVYYPTCALDRSISADRVRRSDR